MGNSSRRGDSSKARHCSHRSSRHHEEESSGSRRHRRDPYSTQPSEFDARYMEGQLPWSHAISSRHPQPPPLQTDPGYYQQLDPQYPSQAADNYSFDARAPTGAEYSQASYPYGVPDSGQNVVYQTASGSSDRARSPSFAPADAGSAIWSDNFSVPNRDPERDRHETQARADDFAQQMLYAFPHVFPHSPRDVESAEEEGRDRASEAVHTFDQSFAEGGRQREAQRYLPEEGDEEERHPYRYDRAPRERRHRHRDRRH